MTYSKTEILKSIETVGDLDPLFYGEILQLVSQKWATYVDAETSRRDSRHLRAMRDMVNFIYGNALHNKKNPKLFTNFECCTLLEACAELFPTGQGDSPSARAVLDHLSKSFHNLGWEPYDNYIDEVRNLRPFIEKLYRNYPPVISTAN